MPFTIEDFFAVFGRYNAAIWPLQPIAWAGGLAVVAAIWRGGWWARAVITLVLAAMWAVNGAGYHLAYFSTINPAARVFGAVFMAQAALLALAPLIFRDLDFRWRPGLRGWAAGALIAYAMVAYPLLGRLAGHSWPDLPEFGVAPCPTTIFTIGVLVLAPWSAARWLLVVPALWALVGGSATVLLGVPQDAGLLAALAVTAGFAVASLRARQRPSGGPT